VHKIAKTTSGAFTIKIEENKRNFKTSVNRLRQQYKRADEQMKKNKKKERFRAGKEEIN